MNSLKVKILGIVCGVIVVILATATYLNFRYQKQLVHRITDSNIQVLNDTIKSSIADAMRSGRSDEVRSILARLSNTSHIASIRILPTGPPLLTFPKSGCPIKIPRTPRSQMK